ncbi:MAG TPA: class I adenylate-forming enzyme family protein, partial [Ktedonobacteraceae bacterium]|nr:class I adenylate-forming enzyme family protein [Ktedonobacteraceae bacterium]
MTFIGVGEWLARREELTPEKIALVDFETQTRLTYRDLNRRARALATMLQEQYAIQPGDRVAALALNSPEYLDAFFAVALLGAILVPLNWRLTARELGVILSDCEPKLLLSDEQHSARAQEVAAALEQPVQVLSMADFPGANVELAARAQAFQSRDGEEPMLILYTSGTTGTPKGAMLSHRMITWNAVNTQISWGLRDTDITPTFA